MPWNDLFTSMAYCYLGINVLIFVDYNKERIELTLPNGIKRVESMFPNTHKNIILLKKGKKYFPVYLINPEIYKHTGIIDSKLFLQEAGLSVIIKSVVRSYLSHVAQSDIKTELDLSILTMFIDSVNKNGKKIEITHLFINQRNLCYGICVSYKGSSIYLPLHDSQYVLQDVEMVFNNVKPSHLSDYSVCQQVYRLYNAFVQEKTTSSIGRQSKPNAQSAHIYPLIKVEQWLKVKSDDDNVIGFMSNGLNYYCKPQTISHALAITNANVQVLMHNPSQINDLLQKFKHGQMQIGTSKSLTKDLQQGLYKHYLYKLFILQYISIFNNQRNTAMRKNIIKTIMKTNFDKDMTPIKVMLDSIIDSDDRNILKNIIMRFVLETHDKKRMLDDINKGYFNFDKMYLEMLRGKSLEETKTALHTLSKKFVLIGDVKQIRDFEFPNVLTSCDENDTGINYCSGSKFVVTKNDLTQMIDILANEMLNPLKWKWLFNSIFIDKSFNFFRFVRRPMETISVEFVN